eukprot:Pompholyxophrys_sp_v1_NODE_98_length_2029_cov_1.880446.p1 type:complete len:452 gc:universal NODE_98_length_2029_cov_1.880446:1405-50(-)
MSQLILAKFVQKLTEVYKEWGIDNPNQIWNMDETGFSFNEASLTTYCKKGRKNVHAKSTGNREHISMVSAICSDGRYIPEFFIYKGSSDFRGCLNGASKGADCISTDKGYMTDAAWPYWMKHFLDCLPPKEERGPLLLILDGYGSHCNDLDLLDELYEQNILLFALPAHTSSQLQPLDVSVFGPLKTYVRNAFQEWMLKNPGKAFNRQFFPALVCESWKMAHSTENIKSGFLKSGIWPHDPQLLSKVNTKCSESFHKSTNPDPTYPCMDIWLENNPEDQERLHQLQSHLCLSPRHTQPMTMSDTEKDQIDAILSFPMLSPMMCRKQSRNSNSIDIPSLARLLNAPDRLQSLRAEQKIKEVAEKEKEERKLERDRKRTEKENEDKAKLAEHQEKLIKEMPLRSLLFGKGYIASFEDKVTLDVMKKFIKENMLAVSLSLKRDEMFEMLSKIIS